MAHLCSFGLNRVHLCFSETISLLNELGHHSTENPDCCGAAHKRRLVVEICLANNLPTCMAFVVMINRSGKTIPAKSYSAAIFAIMGACPISTTTRKKDIFHASLISKHHFPFDCTSPTMISTTQHCSKFRDRNFSSAFPINRERQRLDFRAVIGLLAPAPASDHTPVSWSGASVGVLACAPIRRSKSWDSIIFLSHT